MKKGFHVFFVFMLIAVLAAIANAGQVTLQTGDDGQYINMPVTGTDSLVIPSGVTSFKVYDDGLGEDDEEIPLRLLREKHVLVQPGFFFDFDEDIYGLDIRITFLARIRDERRFPSLEDLRRQLILDRDACSR